METVNAYATGVKVGHVDLNALFPQIDPQFKPLGARILVQLRRVVTKTASGILLTDGTQQSEAWNMQVGKVIALGPLAFKNRKTAEPWPEGAWAKIGDYVRFPRWGGDRITVDLNDGEPPVVVLVLNDADLYGLYEGDPRDVRTFIE